MKRKYTLFLLAAYVGLIALVSVTPVSAHDGPTQGNEWLMADWMLLSFLIFFGVGLIAFITALKQGLLNNLEDAKYYILTIDEKDYYTPEWAKEGDHEFTSTVVRNFGLDQQDPSTGSKRE